MADKLEGNSSSESGHAARSKAGQSKSTLHKSTIKKQKRKTEKPTITDDLSGRFLRVGNKIFRTSDDKTPLVRLEPDRLKTSNIDALPDV